MSATPSGELSMADPIPLLAQAKSVLHLLMLGDVGEDRSELVAGHRARAHLKRPVKSGIVFLEVNRFTGVDEIAAPTQPRLLYHR